ncbi:MULTISPECIES: tRNA (adenosine(37)-N6)-threonylcarbamoyltransferase complex dimerization subunit type 1 TsaB [Gemella]|uniref:tRNA (adenosine(37)-N6)-threonylcarbamoyltransferase complex dimerization subunit type 1 TsaB n=1 Tax=Gemella TaxID=1378 RepID=UPI000767E47A|nr:MULTISPECIES: tRNA (adenosine(37)-N6)-threonylcarbamoyltransferase complex dimerization subunit type 1 TsaB [Gemella]AME09724.1 tRNA threonylcarbamoyladenosine biosynthesis protein TsaB [Gemella sp. oral taxon 928]AXI27326.1 tRNA (adenosine(37)-N6)-threonylcarbamoyltransferase complex dimerization subunit type 1 TsaB [Gemella sp. ND 6198]
MVSLVVEASNSFLSVACLKNDKVLAERNISCSNNLSSIILTEIDRCLNMAGVTKKDLKEIISSKGPGSYTAIRVVAAVCKTFSYALKIPIKVISSLKLQALIEYESDKLIVPVIDARRGSVFGAAYKREGNDLVEVLEESYYTLVELNDFILSQNIPTIYVGKDVEKLSDKLLDNTLISINTDAIKAANILKIYNYLEKSDCFNMTPQYLRRTEAERELKNDKSK